MRGRLLRIAQWARKLKHASFGLFGISLLVTTVGVSRRPGKLVTQPQSVYGLSTPERNELRARVVNQILSHPYGPELLFLTAAGFTLWRLMGSVETIAGGLARRT